MKNFNSMADSIKKITIGGELEEIARKFPFNLAVKYAYIPSGKFAMTYYEFNSYVDKIAKGLMGIGLKKGDKIAVWATNYPEYLVLIFAAAKIGVVLVPINPQFKSVELGHVIKHSEAKVLFFCDGQEKSDAIKILEKIYYTNGRHYPGKYPNLERIITFDTPYKGIDHWGLLEDSGCFVTDEEYEKRKASLSPEDVISIQYTSGTTGSPKGVMLTHEGLINNGTSIGDCLKLTEKDRVCIPVPFYHCFGIVLSIMSCMTHGSTMLPILRYSTETVFRILEREEATVLHGVPSMFERIINYQNFDDYNFSQLRTGIMAGANCLPELMKQVEGKMGMKIISVYGLTEASPGCTASCVDDPMEKRINTVGRSLPWINNKIINPEIGEEAKPGEKGEFCTNGYHVMKGYYNNEEATNEAIDNEGWLYTGDIAEVDDEGYFKITGRIKDIIIRGGENIYPSEIENHICQLKGIASVSVVGVPSEEFGEEVCACIRLKEGVEGITSEDIKRHVEKNMARYKIPSYVLFFETDFPTTGNGKVRKVELKEIATEQLGLS